MLLNYAEDRQRINVTHNDNVEVEKCWLKESNPNSFCWHSRPGLVWPFPPFHFISLCLVLWTLHFSRNLMLQPYQTVIKILKLIKHLGSEVKQVGCDSRLTICQLYTLGKLSTVSKSQFLLL